MDKDEQRLYDQRGVNLARNWTANDVLENRNKALLAAVQRLTETLEKIKACPARFDASGGGGHWLDSGWVKEEAEKALTAAKQLVC